MIVVNTAVSIEIAFQWTFSFVDQLQNYIRENWYSVNIDKTPQ